MKFKIDENLPIEIADLLNKAGYDAMTVGQQNLSGEADRNIAFICRHEKRILITLDTDFSNIMVYPPHHFFGLVVLRLKQQDKLYVLKVVTQLIKLLTQRTIERQLWIVEDTRIRIRS